MARRTAVWVLLLCSLLSAYAYAHLTGAFADYLVTVHDEQTTNKLKQEMAKTKEEIEALSPRVDQLERQYDANRQTAVNKLKLYYDQGLDTWMSLLLQNEALVDVLGNQWLAERQLESYMQELNRLYAEFSQLKVTKASLEGHERLLSIIEENLQARYQFLADNPDVAIDQLANYLDIDWMSEVEKPLIQSLEQDRSLTEGRLSQWAVPYAEASGAQSYKLEEQWLNGNSALSYFFRSDHVYVVYTKKDIHVILIGQVLKQDDGSFASFGLQFEAGFFNGFLMPATLLDELNGFRLVPERLLDASASDQQADRTVPSGRWELQQTNGALLLKSSP